MSIIGILVDGQAEYQSLPLLIPRINLSGRVLKPLYCDMQPYAPLAQIANSVLRRIPILVAKSAETVVVLLDKERRIDCGNVRFLTRGSDSKKK